ncbi:MAG: hypothetical protein IID03_11725 [Candidatus Dadabacteria bacterium]|nr:hypothetical protein [Candidatus Dadabacteria bacterium]
MSKNGVCKETELTPLQEKAVYLFAGGKNVTDTAKELQTDRATLYYWQKQPEFEAFYNKVRGEYKEQAKNELINLFSQALNTIKDCLQSKNENVKLKTAIYILEQTKDFGIGHTNKEAINKDRTFDFYS